MNAPRSLALAHALSQLAPQLLSKPRSVLATSDRDDWMWSPDADVFERNDTFIVRIDLPGVALSDVRVDVSESDLTVSGERRCESHEPGDIWEHAERPHGRFLRRVLLPEGACPTQTRTSLANGVLEITVPIIPYVS